LPRFLSEEQHQNKTKQNINKKKSNKTMHEQKEEEKG